MIIPALIITLSTTLAVIPSIMIRYAILSKLVTKTQVRRLLHTYLSFFVLQNIMIFCLLLFYNNSVNTLFYKLLNIILGTVYFCINCYIIKGMFFKHFFVLGMQGCFSLVLHSLSSILLSYRSFDIPIKNQLIEHSILYIIFFILIAPPLWHFLKDSLALKYSNNHEYYWNIIWLIPGLLFISNLLLTYNDTWISTWNQLISRLLMGVTIYILFKCINLDFKELNEKYTLKSENRLLQLQMDAITNQAEIITENESKVSILRHDLRHHVQILSSLIENSELTAASTLLAQLNDELESTRPITFCMNPIINASLLVYINKAHKEHIEVISEIDIPKDIPWNSSDLAILFANVIENAIVANRQQEPGEKLIQITTRYQDRKLVICIKNRFDKTVEFDAQHFPVTTRENHGTGIKSISSIVEKYHSHMVCSCENGWFSFSFLFSEYPGMK